MMVMHCNLHNSLQPVPIIFLNCICYLLHSTDKIKNLFINIEFSPAGSVEREAEELVYLMFIDLLHDIEGRAKQ